MRIMHLCLANFYIDNFTYQENMITKYHKIAGHDVYIVASLQTFDENGDVSYITSPKKYKNEHDVLVKRLAYSKGILNMSRRLRRYVGLSNELENFSPDIIFIHGVQFCDIKKVIEYKKRNPSIRIYVDNHADFSNSARSFISKNILHKILWRRMAKKIEPYTNRFYGVLPARVEFLRDVYKIPESKIELLVMGADDEQVTRVRKKEIRDNFRKRYNIKKDDLVLITGGKIDKAKLQTITLVEFISKHQNKKIKLLLFGSIIEEIKNELLSYFDDEKLIYLGWLNTDDTYEAMAAADLGVFPGRHSVIWEQCIGVGLPLLVKRWHGTTHIDLGGNCLFLENDTEEHLGDKLNEILNNPQLLQEMKGIAMRKGMDMFSYNNIASKAIEGDRINDK